MVIAASSFSIFPIFIRAALLVLIIPVVSIAFFKFAVSRTDTMLAEEVLRLFQPRRFKSPDGDLMHFFELYYSRHCHSVAARPGQ